MSKWGLARLRLFEWSHPGLSSIRERKGCISLCEKKAKSSLKVEAYKENPKIVQEAFFLVGHSVLHSSGPKWHSQAVELGAQTVCASKTQHCWKPGHLFLLVFVQALDWGYFHSQNNDL